MVVKEKRKVEVILDKDEWDVMKKSIDFLNKLADVLDGYGVLDAEYEELIDKSIDGIAKLEDLMVEGFEKDYEEEE